MDAGGQRRGSSELRVRIRPLDRGTPGGAINECNKIYKKRLWRGTLKEKTRQGIFCALLDGGVGKCGVSGHGTHEEEASEGIARRGKQKRAIKYQN